MSGGLRTPKQLAQSAAIEAVTNLAMEWPANVSVELVGKTLDDLYAAREALLLAE